MYDFIEYVLWELRRSVVLVFLAGIAAAAALAAVYLIHRRKHPGDKQFPWRKTLLWFLFAGYLVVIASLTLLRGVGGYREWNLHLFRAWREAWNNYSVKNWANVLLNVAMFVPMGFLLPLIGKKFRKWYLTVPAGFAVSLGIELLQLAIGRGICDVDDLFANTLGTVIGFFAIMTILSAHNEKGNRMKPGLAYGCLTLASIMAISSIFVVYELKEYGNLPNAAAYTNNTSGTRWNLDCELPAAESEAPVYKTQTRSIEECDVFAEEFRKLVDTEYTTITYYQEAAYYMDQSGDENGTHFLFVSYLDPGYDYSYGIGDNPVWADADRETIQTAVSYLPVFIPDYADFTAEGDGWHSFTVHQHIDGSVMVDGVLRCRYAKDGTIRELENHLLSYSYHDIAAIISPSEAFERMCDGKFSDMEYFERKKPSEVTVSSCTFGYEIDTKGFYQPVYRFEVSSRDGSYTDCIMIPAMR